MKRMQLQPGVVYSRIWAIYLRICFVCN